MNKKLRDICLTIGSIGLITVSVLFLSTLITSLKFGKLSFFILVSSLILVMCGLSKENRLKIKRLFFPKNAY